jgi:hypothetical protein
MLFDEPKAWGSPACLAGGSSYPRANQPLRDAGNESELHDLVRARQDRKMEWRFAPPAVHPARHGSVRNCPRREQDQGHVPAKLRRAAEHAGLTAHKQGLYSMLADRRKDLSDRGRDQGCLPSPGTARTVPRCGENAPAESGQATPSIHRATVRRSCCILCQNVRRRKSGNLIALGACPSIMRYRVSGWAGADARRRDASPPPRALTSPRKPHARGTS